MIIESILNRFWFFIVSIFEEIHFPALPHIVKDMFSQLVEIVTNAVALVGVFIHIPTAMALLGITFTIVGAEFIYRLVMWILRKIPLASLD